jgi:hypothetical protein
MGNFSYPAVAILALCRKYGPELHVPPGLDGAAVMFAIAQNESSGGADCVPRHEPAYDRGGTYDEGEQHELLLQYGRAAACSYGPWQVMAVNAAPLTPLDLATDADAGARAFVQFFNQYVIREHNARSLSEIAQIYNAGHVSKTPSPGVTRYVQDLRAAYTKLAGGVPDAPSFA